MELLGAIRKKKQPKDNVRPLVPDKMDYRSVVKSSRNIAEELSPLVGQHTVFIGVDKSARPAIYSLRKALEEKGIRPPEVHYINYSSRHLLSKNPLSKFLLSRTVSKGIKKIEEEKEKEGAEIKNVVIIDEYAQTGKTLHNLKKAFSKATKKPVYTVSLAVPFYKKPVYQPDITDIGSDADIVMNTMRNKAMVVKDKWSLSGVKRTEPNPKGAGPYRDYVSRIDEEFSGTAPKPPERKTFVLPDAFKKKKRQ